MLTSKRIYGLDVARSLAIFIMIFVNFQTVLAKETTEGWLVVFFNLLHGKGSALFVVLAGVGISLMLKSALDSNNLKLLRDKKLILLKRSMFLFVLGMLSLPFWTADILHFYGFFISLGVLVVGYKTHWLWVWIASLIIIYPLILDVVNYDTGWDWKTLEYEGLWEPIGFLRNLFINGFHPVLPWVAFVFAGIWLGRQDLLDRVVQKRILIASMTLFVIIQIVSYLLMDFALTNSMFTQEDAIAMFGTEPMPPMPFYMVSAISLSFGIIIFSIIITEKYRNSRLLYAFGVSGQLALTHYIGHLIIGILGLYLLFGEKMLSLISVFWYALALCFISILFSLAWKKHYDKDPLSMLMRYFSG